MCIRDRNERARVRCSLEARASRVPSTDVGVDCGRRRPPRLMMVSVSTIHTVYPYELIAWKDDRHILSCIRVHRVRTHRRSTIPRERAHAHAPRDATRLVLVVGRSSVDARVVPHRSDRLVVGRAHHQSTSHDSIPSPQQPHHPSRHPPRRHPSTRGRRACVASRRGRTETRTHRDRLVRARAFLHARDVVRRVTDRDHRSRVDRRRAQRSTRRPTESDAYGPATRAACTASRANARGMTRRMRWRRNRARSNDGRRRFCWMMSTSGRNGATTKNSTKTTSTKRREAREDEDEDDRVVVGLSLIHISEPTRPY